MPILLDDDKDKKDAPEQGTPPMSATPISNGGGAFAGSGDGSNAAAGGGTGGDGGAWTNIQDYMKANEGSTASSDLLNSKVGSAFDKENTDFDSKVNDAKSQAKSQVDQNNLGQDEAAKLVSQAGQNYQYSSSNPAAYSSGGALSVQQGGYTPGARDVNNAPTGDYNQYIDQLRTKLGASYGGPTSFAYGQGADTQNYGNSLKTDPGFNGIMNSLYQSNPDAPLTAGGLALQQQLDTNNPNVNQARTNLINKYAGLVDHETQGATDANQYLTDMAGQFDSGKASLKSSLSDMAAARQRDIGQAVKQYNIDEGNIKNNRPGAGFNVSYTPGVGADESNVDGVDQQRNEYNAIMDALGMGSKIQRSPNHASHGSWGGGFVY